MTVGQFIALRKTLGLSQTAFAERLGLSLRAIQDIEGGASKLRPIHVLAAERVALAMAVETKTPMYAPTNVRSDAVALARELFDEGWNTAGRT